MGTYWLTRYYSGQYAVHSISLSNKKSKPGQYLPKLQKIKAWMPQKNISLVKFPVRLLGLKWVRENVHCTVHSFIQKCSNMNDKCAGWPILGCKMSSCTLHLWSSLGNIQRAKDTCSVNLISFDGWDTTPTPTFYLYHNRQHPNIFFLLYVFIFYLLLV